MVRQRQLRLLLLRWREFVDCWLQQQNAAATAVQAQFRRWVAQYYYSWQRQRMRIANSRFLVASQLHCDFYRTAYLRAWFDLYQQRVRHRSADVILETLYFNGYSKILRTGMGFILGAIKIKRRYIYRRVMLNWKQRYVLRQRKHARVSIRFFIRGCCERRRQQAAEAALVQLEAALKLQREQQQQQQQQSVQYQKNYAPLIKGTWDIWYGKYHVIKLQKLKQQLSRWLAKLFYNKKGREFLRSARSRSAGQRALPLLRWHRTAAAVFHRWRFNAAARRIQRFALVTAAHRISLRLQLLRDESNRRYHSREIRLLQSIIRRWDKFIFLQRRERIRASYKVVKLFRIAQLRVRLSRCSLRKINASLLLRTSHEIFLRSCWRKLQQQTTFANKTRCLCKVFYVFRIFALRCALLTWRRLLQQQQIMQQLSRIRVLLPLESRFFVTAVSSCRIRRLGDCSGVLYRQFDSDTSTAADTATATISAAPIAVVVGHGNTSALTATAECNSSSSNDQYADIFRLRDDKKPFESRFKRWEEYVPTRPALLNTQQLLSLRAFKTWAVAFRMKQRLLRGSSRLWASQYVLVTVRTVANRKYACRTIQNWYRTRKAVFRIRQLREVSRRQQELHVLLSRRLLLRFWSGLRHRRVHRCDARLLLQCAFRCALAVVSSQQQRCYRQQLRNAADSVGSSVLQRSLAARCFHAMQSLYCRSMHRKLQQSAQLPSLSSYNNSGYRNNSGSNNASTVVMRKQKKSQHSSSSNSKQQKKKQQPAAIRFSKSASHLQQISDDSNSYSNYSNNDYNSDDEDALAASVGSNSDSEDSDDEFLTKNQRLIRKFEKSQQRKIQQQKKHNFVDRNIRNAATVAAVSTKQQQRQLYDRQLHSNRSFQSEVCHAHLHRLNSSGVFVFDSQQMQQQQQQQQQWLTEEELRFCIEHADACFLQQANKFSLRQLADCSFSGSKLVLCGGSLSADAVAQLLAKRIMLSSTTAAPASTTAASHVVTATDAASSGVTVTVKAAAEEELRSRVLVVPEIRVQKSSHLPPLQPHQQQQPATTDTSSDSSNNDSVVPQIALHLVAVRLGNTARLTLIKSLININRQSPTTTATATSARVVLRVCELSVDTVTLGALHAALLLRSLQDNSSIRRLIIKCSDEDSLQRQQQQQQQQRTSSSVLPCFGESLLALSSNTTLQELRLFGAALPATVLDDLLRAVREGFRALKALEFSCDFIDSTRAETIVDAAKSRAYSSYLNAAVGLSVTVNYL